MSTFKTKLKRYIYETLGIEVDPVVWQPSRRLPLFLRDSYSYYKIQLIDTDFLVLFDKDPDRSAANIQKHFQAIRQKWDGGVVYSRAQISSLDRKRLIERKIPFIIPGNQMYLPMLGIDLREYFRQLHDDVEKFSPATQAAILLLLTRSERESLNAQELAARLNYSKMTMSRSLNDLKSIDVVSTRGRERKLEFDGGRRALWDRALPFLESPVKQTQHILTRSTQATGPKAGLTALAERSMLAAPISPRVAMTIDECQKLLLKEDVSTAKETDPNSVCIEIWSYDPNLFAKDNMVDPFSLYLSLRNDPDERVEEALEEMMEGVAW